MSGQALAKPSFATLVDLSAAKGTQSSACSSALSELREALDAIGVPTARPAVPTVDALRVVLLQIGNQGGPGSRMVVVCGQGGVSDGQFFMVPAELGLGNGDLSRKGVSADTFARVAGAGGLTALDITPLSGADIPDAPGQRWQAAADPNTSRLIVIERTADTAALVTRLTAAAKGRGDAMLSAFLGVQAEAEPAALSAPAASAPPEAAPAKPAAAVSPAPAAVSEAAGAAPAADAGAKTSGAAAAPVPPGVPAADTGAKTSETVAAPVPPGTPAADAGAKTSEAAAAPAAPGAPAADAGAKTSEAVAAHDTKSMPAKPAAGPHAPVKRVKMSNALRQVQVGLLAEGLYHGEVSGVVNAATVQAIRQYQTKLGHTATGRLTSEERNTLMTGR